MDFCIRQSNGTAGAEKRDGAKVVGQWHFSWRPSGNTELLHSDEGPVLVLGTLVGALRESKGLVSGDKKTLGRDAMSSNGSFAVVIPREGGIQVVTDAGGSIPLYWGNGPNGPALGTEVQKVARCTGLTTVDEVSVADYLINGTVCYPYSWFEQVQALPPGSVCTVDRDGLKAHAYYAPEEPDDIYDDCDPREWGRRLREEVCTALQHGLKGKKSARVLFSGGEDSRGIASLIPDTIDCTPTIVLSRRNREYRLARRAARWLGYPLDLVIRPNGFYRTSIPERIEAIGPGWDFRHTHFFGEIADELEDTDVIVGGYLADTLFKTYYMTNVDTYHRSRRPPQLHGPEPNDLIFPVRESVVEWLREGLVKAVENRRQNHHGRLKQKRPLTAGNWHQLWPLTPRAYPAYLASLRTGPKVVEPFLFHQVYQLAARMPDRSRVDRRAFRYAFCKPMGAAGWLPDSSDRIPCLGGWTGSLFRHYRRRFRNSQVYKALFGEEKGYQKAWSPDHAGWNPVNPEEHFGDEGAERVRERLSRILADGDPRDFLQEESLADGVKVRALALGYDVREIATT